MKENKRGCGCAVTAVIVGLILLVAGALVGWYLLGILACGIGLFFVAPYVSAAEAEVYAELRNSVSGFPLRGFGERNTDSSGETENEGWGGYENQE